MLNREFRVDLVEKGTLERRLAGDRPQGHEDTQGKALQEEGQPVQRH